MPTTPSRRRLPLTALAVLLLALFQAGPAAAAPWTSLWNWLSAWAGGSWTSAIGRSDLGPTIDPDGQPTATSGQGDLGPLIDPNGRPTSATGRSDLGPSIDPEGRPTATSGQGDHGPTIDPLGGGR